MELHSLGFEKTHYLEHKDPSLKFKLTAGSKLSRLNTPMVYIWCGIKEKKQEILYVGKAGFGVSKRLKEHEGGFKNSTTGRKNYKLLKAKFDDAYAIEVYSKEAEFSEIFGIQTSLYSAEEEALIRLLSPLWNRASKKDKDATPEDQSQSRAFTESFDLSGVPGIDLVYQFFESLDCANKKRFNKLINYAVELSEKYSLKIRIVNGYQSQPKYYNRTAMLVVADFSTSGCAKRNTWKVRIPLRCDSNGPLTVILPKRVKKESIPENEVSYGKYSFRPINIDDFLKRKSRFIDP